MELRNSGRTDYVFPSCIFYTISDVVMDVRAEQEYVLLYDSNVSAQRIQREISDVLAIDGYTSFRYVVESRQEIDYGALSAPRGSKDRCYLVRFSVYVDVF